MARKQDIDWSDWKGSVQLTQHPLSAPINTNLKKGADVVNNFLSTCAQSILRDIPKQPTNERMFGHLVKTEAEIKAINKKWENSIHNHKELYKPIDHLNKSKIEATWGEGKSFNSLLKEQLSKEELAQRNMCVQDIDVAK
jgi:hypothetical protein